MKAAFSRSDISIDDCAYLNRGRWGNADLYRHLAEGREWVVKDFRCCPPVIRRLWGSVMVRRELRALRRLDGIRGIPRYAFRLDAYALCYQYMPGATLAEADPGRTPPEFFETLEKMVRQMHSRGICHLDIRYRRNILVLSDGLPGLIDFQSHLDVSRLPAVLRRWLEQADLSGVYKHWCVRWPGTLTADRLQLLRSADRRRGMWIFKGYGLRLKPRKKRNYGPAVDKEREREGAF